MALIELKVPDIGDFHDVAVIELLVQPGASVRAEQSLLTVESDKASMEIPSSHSGVIRELTVKLGDKVSQGSRIGWLEVADAPAAPPPDPAPMPAAAPSKPQPDRADAASSALNSAANAGALVELRVPDIGDFKDVAVIEIMVKPGDAIKLEQSLITVESDKASMEIPASAAGVLQSLAVKLGDKVSAGSLLGVVQTAAAAGTAAPAVADRASNPLQARENGGMDAADFVASGKAAAAPAEGVVAVLAPAHQPGAAPLGLPHASPSVRKFARELGVPLEQVPGSGPKGRITMEDVQAYSRRVMSAQVQTPAIAAQQAAAVAQAAGTKPAAADGAGLGLIPWPQVDFAKFGPIERKELSRIKKISGANLLRNAVMIPAVTNHDDADITDLEAFRLATNQEHEKSGIKVTMLAFLVKACVAALKKYPEFNSSLDGDALVLKNYWHIGFAADTPNGLVVPVIKDADRKGVLQISQEMADLAKKAREGKLAPADMSGASFTISSLGGIGGRYFTPIINAPEVAILGVCKSYMAPVWDGGQFVPRLMLPLSLTWDHRVIDGAAAARFNVYLGQILADFRRVLL